MSEYRSDLPPIPARLRSLPVDRGYPVPWFVPFIDGKPEFRMGDPEKLLRAIKGRLCWVCGEQLGRYMAFVIGPMCSINRISAEPPCHKECAEFSAMACPFLIGKQPERREGDLPKALPEVGLMIRRNPGCCAVWITTEYDLVRAGHGVLFAIGEPTAIKWFAKGREATRAEVMASIESGAPILMAEAERKGPEAIAALAAALRKAEALLPVG